MPGLGFGKALFFNGTNGVSAVADVIPSFNVHIIEMEANCQVW